MGPLAAPLSNALISATLAGALCHARSPYDGAFFQQLTTPSGTSLERNVAQRPLTTLISLVDRTIAGLQSLHPQEIRNQARSLRLFIVRHQALLQGFSRLASRLNGIIRHYRG